LQTQIGIRIFIRSLISRRHLTWNKVHRIKIADTLPV